MKKSTTLPRHAALYYDTTARTTPTRNRHQKTPNTKKLLHKRCESLANESATLKAAFVSQATMQVLLTLYY